jgi:hypothetical protein
MEKELLEQCLADGMSLEAIGELVGKHESTVSYWLKKHGLTAAKAGKHVAKGAPSKGRWNGFLPPVYRCGKLLIGWIAAWGRFATGCGSTS